MDFSGLPRPQESGPIGQLLGLIIVILGSVGLVQPAHAATAPWRLAIAPLTNHGKSQEWQPFARGFAEMLTSDLEGLQALTLVERSHLDGVVQELGLQQGAFVDPATAQKMGKGLGASHVLVGGFIIADKLLRVDARLVEVKTAQVALSASEQGPSDDVFGIERRLADKIAQLLDKRWQSRGQGGVVSAQEVRQLGSTLGQIDAGQLEQAGKQIELMALARPELSLIASARAQLHKAIEERLLQQAEQTRAIPAGIRARLDQVAAGQAAACQPMIQDCMALQGAIARGMMNKTMAQYQKDHDEGLAMPAAEPAVEVILGAAYGLVQNVLQDKRLAEPTCDGNRPAGWVVMSVWLPLAGSVRGYEQTCNPVLLAAKARPDLEIARCGIMGERLLFDVTDAKGQILVPRQDLLPLLLRWGQALMQQAGVPTQYGNVVAPLLRELLAAQELRDLTPAASQAEVGRRKTEAAKLVLRQHPGTNGVSVFARVKPMPLLPNLAWGMAAELRLILDPDIALQLSKITLTLDNGQSWQPWPLAQGGTPFVSSGLPGKPGSNFLAGLPSSMPIGLVPTAERWSRDTPPQPQATRHGPWLETATVFGETAWTETSFGQVKARLHGSDGQVIGTCESAIDPVAYRLSRTLKCQLTP